MSVVTCFNSSTHPAKDHLIQAFLHHTDRSLNHLEVALSPFVGDYYASPVWEVISLPHIYSLVIRVLYSLGIVCQDFFLTFSIVPPRFELGQGEPKSPVLPLHQGTYTEREGFEPPEPLTRFSGFQDHRIQPLCHRSRILFT